MLNPSSLCRKTTIGGLASLNRLYMKCPAFGGSILRRAFELSPTLFCWCTGTATIFLWRNIAEILPEKDIKCIAIIWPTLYSPVHYQQAERNLQLLQQHRRIFKDSNSES